MKITPKPIVNSDRINKARDVSGLRKWSRESKLFGGVMYVLGWFTIPAEVFLRRNFGRRWFTPMNFYAGAFLIMLVGGIQYLIDKIHFWITHFQSSWNPFYTSDAPSEPNYIATQDIELFLLLYVVLSAYHLMGIWWRADTEYELHSYDDGTSRLEPVAGFLMVVVNAMAIPFVALYMLFLSRDKRSIRSRPPDLITDRSAFANTILEPLIFYLLARDYPCVAGRCWLYITALAVAIHANWKEAARRSKVLDLRDRKIEAQVMAKIRSERLSDPAKSTKKNPKEKSATPSSSASAPQSAVPYPALAVIIEQFHKRTTPRSVGDVVNDILHHKKSDNAHRYPI